MLDPSSPWGYERKHAALHNAGDYENAINAFEAMVSKISQSPELEFCGEGIDITRSLSNYHYLTSQSIIVST